MGLTVQVGILADLKGSDQEGYSFFLNQFEKMNTLLHTNGIASYKKQETVGMKDLALDFTHHPYSRIRYLRRFYAHVVGRNQIPELLSEGEDPAEDPAIEDEAMMFESHLLCHSDSEGYYLPVDFDELLTDDSEEIVGGFIGSSYQLKRELEKIAEPLGILLDGEGNIQNDLLEVAEKQIGYWREQLIWMTLYEACQMSLLHKTAIVFT